MPYDPAVPATNAELTSAMFRGQFQGLKALIDAFGGVTSAQVDGVNTTDPTNPALANVSLVGDTLHFTFTIPRGNDGQQGIPGMNGNNGNDGGPGPQGPPFAQAVIDAVNTLNPGENATVSVVFDGSNVRFTFNIPRGFDGPQGMQGSPGEVSTAQLNDAVANVIASTSANTNAIATLDTPFANDPPSLADMEVMRAKVNEMILNGRRP